MINLQEIKDPQKLEEYFRFRYKIYSECGKSAFLKGSGEKDVDEFDENALHLGWYVKGELVGCVRIIKAKVGKYPLHCFTHTPSEIVDMIQTYSNWCQSSGAPFVEVSRICISHNKRNAVSIKQFVLATMSYAHQLGLNHAIITCDKNHMPFWKYMGFEIMDNTDVWNAINSSMKPSYCMKYDYFTLPDRILSKLNALQSNQVIIAA